MRKFIEQQTNFFIFNTYHSRFFFTQFIRWINYYNDVDAVLPKVSTLKLTQIADALKSRKISIDVAQLSGSAILGLCRMAAMIIIYRNLHAFSAHPCSIVERSKAFGKRAQMHAQRPHCICPKGDSFSFLLNFLFSTSYLSTKWQHQKHVRIEKLHTFWAGCQWFVVFANLDV